MLEVTLIPSPNHQFSDTNNSYINFSSSDLALGMQFNCLRVDMLFGTEQQGKTGSMQNGRGIFERGKKEEEKRIK